MSCRLATEPENNDGIVFQLAYLSEGILTYLSFSITGYNLTTTTELGTGLF